MDISNSGMLCISLRWLTASHLAQERANDTRGRAEERRDERDVVQRLVVEGHERVSGAL